MKTLAIAAAIASAALICSSAHADQIKNFPSAPFDPVTVKFPDKPKSQGQAAVRGNSTRTVIRAPSGRSRR